MAQKKKRKKRTGPRPQAKPTAPAAAVGLVRGAGAQPPRGPAPVRPTRRVVAAKAETPIVEERQVPVHNCATGVLAGADPQGLAVSYTFDTGGWSTSGPVAIAFTGTRLDGTGQPGDRFERVERLGDMGPTTGKVAITTRLGHVTAGRWRIVAGPAENPAGHPLPRKAVVTSTQFSLLAQGPGVRLFAWPGLIALGAVVAVLVQALLAGRSGLPVAPILGFTLLGCVLGFFGGKVWYLVVNRRPVREFLSSGACIQGFLLVAVSVLLAGAAVLDVSAGAVLDATAPGIFFGMAIGRPGCFLTGCCVGRPTTSPWGLWSSDRRLGIRRWPVQLYEAGSALLIGVVGLLLVVAVAPPFPGAVFIGSIAAYTGARQFLFRLRSNSHTRLGRLVVQAVCGAILLGVLVAYLTT